VFEYVFFDQRPFDQFVKFLEKENLIPVLSKDDECFEAAIPEDIDDELSDRIEVFYEEMMELNQQLFEEDEKSSNDMHVAGVVLNLKQGATVYANVDTDVLARIMSVLTPLEFGTVVDAIVDAVEEPDHRPICKREN